MSEEVLSQDEVESLLQAMEASKAEEPGGGGGGGGDTGASGGDGEAAAPVKPWVREKVQLYDFKRPERFGKDQMRSLQTMHEGFSRNFAAALSAMLRSLVEVRLTGVDQLTYSEFVFSLDNPTCFNVLRREPLEGDIILDINPGILFPIIDRLLGGGKDATPAARRALTEIELRLVSRVTTLFLKELTRAWENVLPLQISLDRVESNPQLVSIVPPNEVVMLISFELTVAKTRGMVNLCIPYNAIERISSRLSANSWQAYGRHSVTDETRVRLAKQLDRSVAELVVTMARSKLTTAELLGLRVGDVITTDHGTDVPIDVSIEGRAKFTAKAGALKGRKAIQILDVLNPPAGESPKASDDASPPLGAP